jgi:hypothetical protein
MGAVPFCTRNELAFRASTIHRESRGQSVAVFRIVDVGGVPCQVDRHATVELLNGRGRPLPFRLTYDKSASHWLVVPGRPVWTGVFFRHTCARNRVATVELSIASLPRAFIKTIPRQHAFAPCHATISFVPMA